MPANIITTDDLREFKIELLDAIKDLLRNTNGKLNPEGKRFLKTAEVQELLDMSPSSLQNLRNARVLPYSKINGTIFYEWDDIVQLINTHKKEAKPKRKLS
jgi:hypothetical protein